ncbi:MAG: tetratricopeptide repeat protein [Thaumarchaeota archaeon]|nr:tetratricopeptide repeat protein [Nitrososphaerota archaeon]
MVASGRAGNDSDVWLDRPYDDAVWCFEFSERMQDVQDRLCDIMDSIYDSPAKAERKLVKIIESSPHAFDAYSQLAYILWECKQTKEAIELLKEGFSKAKELFPKGFVLGASKLPWGVLENRPFLRMYGSLGVRYWDLGDFTAAKKIFEDIVEMNPDDNQGVRELLCSCYFELGDKESVLKLCEMYEDDAMPAIMFGRVLVLFRFGRLDEARRALLEAAKYSGNVAMEIMKNKHKAVKTSKPAYIVSGSPYEAQLYWHEFGRHWQETLGAVEFVRREARR